MNKAINKKKKLTLKEVYANGPSVDGAASFRGGPFGFGNKNQLATTLNPATQAIENQEQEELNANVNDQQWSLDKYPAEKLFPQDTDAFQQDAHDKTKTTEYVVDESVVLTEKSFEQKDIPKWFWLVFDINKGFSQLQNHELIGIEGIAGHKIIASKFLDPGGDYGVDHNGLLIMPGKDLVGLNQITRIMYDNPDYLASDNFKKLTRITMDKPKFIIFKIINNLGVFVGRDKYFETLSHNAFNDFKSSFMVFRNVVSDSIDSKHQPNINSVNDICKWLIDLKNDYIEKNKNHLDKNLLYALDKHWTFDEIKKSAIRILLEAAESFKSESEWLIKDKQLKIPRNSKVLLFCNDPSKFRKSDASVYKNLKGLGYDVGCMSRDRFKNVRGKVRDKFQDEFYAKNKPITAEGVLREKSFEQSDIPKFFWLVFNLKQLDTLNQLLEKELRGIKGISGSKIIVSKFLDQREYYNAVLILPGQQTVQLNNLSKVNYENPDYLVSNNFKAFSRIAETTEADVVRRIFNRIIHFDGGLPILAAHKINNLYLHEKPIINSVNDFVKWFKTTLKKTNLEDKIKPGLNYRNYVIYYLHGLPYKEEVEWIVKNETLKIPNGTKMFMICPNHSQPLQSLADYFGWNDLEGHLGLKNNVDDYKEELTQIQNLYNVSCIDRSKFNKISHDVQKKLKTEGKLSERFESDMFYTDLPGNYRENAIEKPQMFVPDETKLNPRETDDYLVDDIVDNIQTKVVESLLIKEKSFEQADIPKFFFAAIKFNNKFIEQLLNKKLDGIQGISSDKFVIPSFWSATERDKGSGLLIMPGKALIDGNNITRVMYDNPDYLVSNNFKALMRIEEYHTDAKTYLISRFFRRYLTELFNDYSYSESDEIKEFYKDFFEKDNQNFTLSNMSDLVKLVLNSNKKLKAGFVDYLQRFEADHVNIRRTTKSFQRLKEVLDFSFNDIMVYATKAILFGSKGFEEENEWLVKDKQLKIPHGSRLVVLCNKNFKNTDTENLITNISHEQQIEPEKLKTLNDLYHFTCVDADKYRSVANSGRVIDRLRYNRSQKQAAVKKEEVSLNEFGIGGGSAGGGNYYDQQRSALPPMFANLDNDVSEDPMSHMSKEPAVSSPSMGYGAIPFPKQFVPGEYQQQSNIKDEDLDGIDDEIDMDQQPLIKQMVEEELEDVVDETFKSKAQARYFYAQANKGGKEGEEWKERADEFAASTPNFSKLPNKTKKNK